MPLTNEQIDRRLAELLGWTVDVVFSNGKSSIQFLTPPDGWPFDGGRLLPRFTTDPAAALWLLEQVCKQVGCVADLHSFFGGEWQCIIFEPGTEKRWEATGRSFAEAIARAALAALEGEG